MNKTGIAAITFAVFGAVTLCSGLVSAQYGQDTTGVSCRAMSMQPEKRLMKMSQSLDLTEAQKAKIKPFLEDESAKIKAIRDDSSLTREQKRTKVREIHSATYEQIKPLLTPDQQKKHDEMRKSFGEWHKKGHFAASPADRLERMNRTLNLTEEQKTKIKPILEDESAKIKAVIDDQSITKQQKRDKVRAIHSATYEQIKPILTPEQQKKHDEMRKSFGERHKMRHCAASPADRLERMNRTLNLTEDQKAKIKPMLENESAKIKALRDDQSITSRQQKRDKMREIRMATFEQIKPLLTVDQLKKHDEIMKQRKGMPKQDDKGNQS